MFGGCAELFPEIFDHSKVYDQEKGPVFFYLSCCASLPVFEIPEKLILKIYPRNMSRLRIDLL